MNGRFGAVRVLATLYQLFGVLVAVGLAGAGVFGGILAGNIGAVLAGVFGGALIGVALYGIGELFLLLVSLEANTRRTADLLDRLEKSQRTKDAPTGIQALSRKG